MNCPVCRVKMMVEDYEGITIDVCPKCQGVWLDDRELKEIVKRRGKRPSPEQIDEVKSKSGLTRIPQEELKRRIICPKCGCRMKPINYSYCSGIIINKCPINDGVWLDQSEIEKVQTFSEGWEEEMKKSREQYPRLSSRSGESTREKDSISEMVSPQRFALINALIRKIVKLD